ncbi:transcriptional repressor LexA [Candidatus Saccharibacteria bacterium]|nr:transcriptional repressor LexA [Candidatus Saccharibacteria bacterium]MCB9834706.1 transcriptional repressor LexA [Candidatus Nomurabacteria bacterium]
MKVALTKKQRKVLDFINKFIEKNGYSPSFREIGRGLKLSSVATVAQHIRALEKKGMISKDNNAARSILPVEDDQLLESGIFLPIMGSIAAGTPIAAVADGSETLEVPSFMISGNNNYVLRVKGQSMIEDGIFDGDYVVIKENQAPRDGEVVVALIDGGEVTLKRIYHEANRIRLQPANSTMEPIYVDKQTSLDIQGVVVGVIRKY